MKSAAVEPKGVTTAATCYSPAIVAKGARLLFVSGQGPRDYDADMTTQIRQTFEQIKAILADAGGTIQNVVMLRSDFLNMARDLPAFREMRQEFLVEPYPAATVVGVTELAVPGLQVEIEAIAVLD